MPFRQKTTELQAFGFDSEDCRSFKGNCDGNEKLCIRIRKTDIDEILNSTAYGTSQIYVRAERQEPLAIQPGYTVKIETKNKILVFDVSSIHMLTSLNQRPRFSRSAVLSGFFVFRKETTELQAFGFDSEDCRSFKGNCDGNEKLFIRIRKKDLDDILNNTAYETSQIYVRVDRQEQFKIQPGSTVNIKTKDKVLVFDVSSIHMLTSLKQRPRLSQIAVLSGIFA
jgi:hypothetical protein